MSAMSPRLVIRRPVLRTVGMATIAFAALLLLLVLAFDWNWLQAPIERRGTEQTGRVLVLGDDMSDTGSYWYRVVHTTRHLP